jgi:hypothetical protein
MRVPLGTLTSRILRLTPPREMRPPRFSLFLFPSVTFCSYCLGEGKRQTTVPPLLPPQGAFLSCETQREDEKGCSSPTHPPHNSRVQT